MYREIEILGVKHSVKDHVLIRKTDGQEQWLPRAALSVDSDDALITGISQPEVTFIEVDGDLCDKLELA